MKKDAPYTEVPKRQILTPVYMNTLQQKYSIISYTTHNVQSQVHCKLL